MLQHDDRPASADEGLTAFLSWRSPFVNHLDVETEAPYSPEFMQRFHMPGDTTMLLTHEQLRGGGHGALRLRDDAHDGLQQVAWPGRLARAAGRDIAQKRQRRDARRLPRRLCTLPIVKSSSLAMSTVAIAQEYYSTAHVLDHCRESR